VVGGGLTAVVKLPLATGGGGGITNDAPAACAGNDVDPGIKFGMAIIVDTGICGIAGGNAIEETGRGGDADPIK